MTLRISVRIALVVAATVLVGAGCGHKSPTEPWPAIVDPIVFTDGASAGVEFKAFGGSKYDALSIDGATSYRGTSSLKFAVPAAGDPTGGYAGGAFVASQSRSLVPFGALSFWVKASQAASLNEAGIGNDNTGTSKYTAVRQGIPITTEWKQVFVPIPLPSKLKKERGLFFLAEGHEGGAANTIWVDDVEFVSLSTVSTTPILTTRTYNKYVGTSVDLVGTTRTVFNLGGTDTAVTVSHMPGYFTFESTNPAVATVTNGVIQVIGAGNATIRAKLGDLDATGSVTVNATAPDVTTPAPTPTVPAGDVLSLFSDAYPVGVPVSTWSATWDLADVTDLPIAGNATKVYQNLSYAGIELTPPPFDATAMTHFHMDVYVPTGTAFKVKLVDFGADGVYGGCPNCGDDRESELTFDAASTPAFTPGSWVSLEIPLDSFAGLTLGRAHLTQIVLSGGPRTVYVDNVYFHK